MSCADSSWGVRTAYVCMACCRGEAWRKLGVRRGARSQKLHSWWGGAVYFGSVHAMIMYAHVGPPVGVSWYSPEEISVVSVNNRKEEKRFLTVGLGGDGGGGGYVACPVLYLWCVCTGK